jgi:zinc transport system permease protein
MLESTLLTALIAGFSLAIVAGPLGCFAVWRRMAFFGDSLAHSGLLGIALGLMFGISQHIAIMAVCSSFALLLVWLQQRKLLATDTLLGILAHAALAIGMVAVELIQHGKEVNHGHHDHIDIHSFLFGDIMTVQGQEVIWIIVGMVGVLTVLCISWRSLLLMALNEDLAKAEGVNTFLMNLLLMFMMAVVVAVSINLVGILLITSMLLIPAASARQITRNPEAMAIIAAFLGMIAIILGIISAGSLQLDVGPVIVVVETILFVMMLFAGALVRTVRI